jgi:hypothetical protein
MFALVQAQRLIDAHFPRQAGIFAQLAEPRVQLALSIRGARRSRCIGGADVVADKNVAFKCGQAETLLD